MDPGVNLWACVNKSGKTINVYDDAYSGRLIGRIMRNEVFVDYGSEGPISIVFRGSNGFITSGFIHESDADNAEGLISFLTDYAYGNEYIHGFGTVNTFKFRRQAEILDRNGRHWGYVGANMLVATDGDHVGQSHNGYKSIVAVKQSGTNKWITISGGGFVDMGFSYGSSGRTMSMYGRY